MAMTLEEFREQLINDIKSEALVNEDYDTDVFIEYARYFNK